MGTTRLLYDSTATDVRPALPKVFGELVKLALPVIASYQSDLYRDALWLERHAQGQEFTFYWSVGPSGTTIGTDERYAQHEYAYRVTVVNDRGQISMQVQP